MRLLLDANALIWWWHGARRLSGRASRAIGAAENSVLISAASVWEIELKRAKRRLTFDGEVEELLADDRIDELPVLAAHVVAAARLPGHHKDPFDRMLVAQAQLEGLTIVTSDPAIARYQVAVLPAS